MIDHEKRIRIWQAAATIRDAAEEMGCAVEAARSWAGNMRHRGVPLKKFTKSMDVSRLIAVAKETAK